MCNPAGVRRWLPSAADRAWEAGNAVAPVPPSNARAQCRTEAVAAAVVEAAAVVVVAVGGSVSSFSDFRR
jgi:hypothetical protein